MSAWPRAVRMTSHKIARWTSYEPFTFADGSVRMAMLTWEAEMPFGERSCVGVVEAPGSRVIAEALKRQDAPTVRPSTDFVPHAAPSLPHHPTDLCGTATLRLPSVKT